jgi:transposase
MGEHLVNVDRDTPMLLPVDLRQWIPEDDLVHFVINAVETMSLPALKVNQRGSGSRQYPPRMMLELMIYCYANGLFGSRRIERATYRDLGVRYLTGDTHPDHDTICSFRRDNREAIKQAFMELLRLAKAMGVLKVGTISVDGTHMKANASKHRSVRYDRAGQLEQLLSKDIEELLARAEASDAKDSGDDQQLPEEIGRREALLEKMRWARQELERRTREEQGQPGDQGDGGQGPTGSAGKPKDSQQINLTDPDSALMRKSKRDGFVQAYNAQAVVDAEGSQMILATDVIRTSSDANQLEAAVDAAVEAVGPVQRVLADGGYLNADAIERLQQKVEVYVAISSEDSSYRRYEFRPPKNKAAKKLTDPRLVAMRQKLRSEEGQRIYRKRACTVEPVFGIIKSGMGLRQFLLRSIARVRLEWELVCLAYNVRRLWSLAGTS